MLNREVEIAVIIRCRALCFIPECVQSEQTNVCLILSFALCDIYYKHYMFSVFIRLLVKKPPQAWKKKCQYTTLKKIWHQHIYCDICAYYA
jgi:hypothetical protein